MLKDQEGMPTAASVAAELEELETMYKSRRKKLRALLAVLEDEEGSTEAEGAADEQ